MGKYVLTGLTGNHSESFDHHLRSIELALESGDVSAAQQHLRAFRDIVVVAPSPAEPMTDALAGGVALTGQEAATLRLLLDGSLSQKDIAWAMGVTRNTLKTHLKSLYLKLGAHCRSEAIHRAREVGLLPRPSAFGEPVTALIDVA